AVAELPLLELPLWLEEEPPFWVAGVVTEVPPATPEVSLCAVVLWEPLEPLPELELFPAPDWFPEPPFPELFPLSPPEPEFVPLTLTSASTGAISGSSGLP